MARTIDEKLTAIKTCKSDIKDRINSIYGSTIVDDETIFEDYASKLDYIEEVKQDLMQAINDKLEGGLTEETPFSLYPNAINNYDPQPEFNIQQVTWNRVPGVEVTLEPEDGLVTSGSIIKATYELEDNYRFINWTPQPLFTINNKGFFQVESDMEITLLCEYVDPQPVIEECEVYTFNSDNVSEDEVIGLLSSIDIHSSEYADFITQFKHIHVDIPFDGNEKYSGNVLAIIIPEDTSLLHVIDNADNETFMIDWCDESNPLIKQIEGQLNIDDKMYNVYYYCGEGPITPLGSTPLRITITSK